MFLLIASVPVRAQLVGHSADLAGYIGDRNVAGVNSDDNIYFGGSIGYNIVPSFTVLGEYAYMPMGSSNGNTEKHELYGGAIHYNLLNIGRVGSYFVVAFDGDKNTMTWNGGSSSVNGYNASFGGGWIFFCGHNWGIRPEIRAVRDMELSVPAYPSIADYPVINPSTTSTANISYVYVSGTVQLFYQFGGRGKKR